MPVIDIEQFSLADGEQVALVGTSGSGKTTLLHLIAGILSPDSGKILFGAPKDTSDKMLNYAGPSQGVNGAADIARLSEAQRDVFRGRHIGYIFQTHHLLAGFTALENVLLGMSFTGRRPERAWARHLLAEVGLSDRLNYKPERLSVGQQQRVAVARALAADPPLLLADEPTGALDPATAARVIDVVRARVRRSGGALLLATHDEDLAALLPQRLSLSDGRLEQQSSVSR